MVNRSPSIRPTRGIWFAVLLLASGMLAGGCGAAHTTSPSPPVPSGFTRISDPQFGFDLALAPGWRPSGRDPEGGVSYAGPNGLTMVVHFEEATSSRLDVATTVELFELTDGAGLQGAKESPGRLAGLPARRVEGRFGEGDRIEALDAYVMLEGRRAWVAALVGAPDAVTAAARTWEQMVSTFRLVGARPTPPPRATVGLPAPSFPLLDRARGPVVINFFATWCADCRSDMPLIAKAAAADRGRFTLIGVDCCHDDASAVPGFLNQLGVQGQFRSVAYDDRGRIAQSYALLGPPTTAFLDRNHVLRQLVVGAVTPTSLQQGLKDADVA
jgi:thiol-disulfide isomerase/thioredoxin